MNKYYIHLDREADAVRMVIVEETTDASVINPILDAPISSTLAGDRSIRHLAEGALEVVSNWEGKRIDKVTIEVHDA